MVQNKAPDEGKANKAPPVDNDHVEKGSKPFSQADVEAHRKSEEQRQKEAGTGVNDLDGLRQSIQRLSQEVQDLRVDRDSARTYVDQKFDEMHRRIEESERRYRESGGRLIREGTQAGHIDDLPKTSGL